MSFAMVFPGQGSQSVGMLADLARDNDIVRETFEAASAVLGYDLWGLTQEGPKELLDATHRTQPALLTAGVAVYRAWRSKNAPEPAVLAGHSLGEYTALVCADAIDFRDAVDLVRFRGEAMQQAVPAGAGAMAAILGLDDEQVAEACRQASDDQVVEPVNFNSPGQVVVAGERDAVDRAVAQAKSLGARRAIILPVSVPSHCALMTEAAGALAGRLAETEIVPPRIPVIHNVDAQLHAEPEEIREVLSQQLYRPVLWTRCIEAIKKMGAVRLVEAGPGKVLAGLVRRIDRDIKAWPVYDETTLDSALAEMK